jgi:RNA polymerase sigma factor (sigma-70 family)
VIVRRQNESGATLGQIEAVYRRDYVRFRQTAVAIVGDLEGGTDSVQDAFALAVRSRAGFRGDAPLEAWLWRIVVNTARTRHRQLASRRAADERTAVFASRNGYEPGGEPEALRALVADLPERQRLALFLRYYADLDYATIAQTLDVRHGTVAATLNAAHRALRQALEEVHP